MNRHFFLMMTLVFGFACASRIQTTAQGNPDASKLKNPIGSTPESIAAGKKSYARCASCHGINGEGGPGNDLIPAAPSLVDEQWDHGSSDGEIFEHQERRAAGFQYGPIQGSAERRRDLESRKLHPVHRQKEITAREKLIDHFASGSGLTWNFNSLLVTPLPPSMWKGARVDMLV